MRFKGIPEALVKAEALGQAVVQMYEGVTTTTATNAGVSPELVVHVGVHQGSVLSPLFFIIVIDPEGI